ncbi:hybrid sensor histidine kinase/response regulator transcription factor [Pseudopedobacter saltans]|nr:two-component regulator propeller domain-containing protein [Pseudopedobacter saltans]
MSNRYALSVLLSALCLTISINALGAGVTSVNHYSSADGLSDNRVTTIIKDREGFVWFGTWAGINRFDGSRFVAFKSNPGDFSSLKSNRIDEIVEDKTSSFLWVRAYDNKIYRFDKRKHVFTSLHDLIKNEPFKKYQFTRILSVSRGKVWLKSTKGNVIVIDDAAGNLPVFNELNALNDSSEKTYFFYLDDNGHAWISNERGLFLIKQNQECKYTISQYVVNSNNPIRLITSDYNGGVWASYENNRIIRLDTLLRKKTDRIITNGKIYDIKLKKDRSQLLCTTSRGELVSIDNNGVSRLVQRTSGGEALFCIYEDKNNGIWLESDRYGVIRLDQPTNRLVGLYPAMAYNFKPWVRNCTFFQDINKTLWASIRGYKLSVYDEEKDQLVEFALNIEGLNRNFSRIILGTFYDPSGALWITTDNGGLDRVTMQGNLFNQNYIKSDHISKAENEVRGLLADRKGRLWIGTKSGRILLNDKGGTLEDPLGRDFKPGGGVYSVYEDKDGLFWIGTRGGGVYLVEERNSGNFYILQHFLNTEQDINLHRSEIYSILQDKKGRIWVATFGGGLVLITQKDGKYQVSADRDKLANYPIDSYGKLRYLNTDIKGNIWIATSEGLILFDPEDNTKGGKFKIYKKEPGNIKSLGGNDIQFVYRDSENQMWVLTSSGGLNLAVGDNPLDTLWFKNYSKKQGFASDFLLACTEDAARNLWISTRNGISKFSLSNGKVQNYSYYDGLHETIFSEGSVAKLKDGKVVFGNILGYLYFHANDLNEKREKGNLVFTNFQINSEDTDPDDVQSPLQTDINYVSKIKLRHNQNIVAVEFAMLESVSASRHNFVYRLVGYDDVWRNTEGQSKVTYTNLPPGSYTFQVRSQNIDLFSGVSYRSLQIEVLPPFWKTWWAYLIYAVLLCIILGFVKRTIATILSLKQGIAVEKRLAEMKLNFFTQISHELRTPLTLIVNPIEEILAREKLSAKGKGYAKVIYDNSKRMVRLVNQVLDLRKVSSGKANLKLQRTDLILFIRNICGYFDNYLSGRQIKIVLQSEFKELFIDIDSDKTETIIYNILANAIKFSPQGGEIDLVVSVDKESKVLKVSVTDEGPGVNDNELDKIFQLYYEGSISANVKGTGIGLALSKELAELHNGKIYAENSNGKGLKVVLELPYLLNEDSAQPFTTEISYVQEITDIGLISDESIIEVQDRKRILIVEDNIDLRSFLNNKFEDFYNIEVAENGEEGLQKAISLLPDLILSDIMMPKMDGIQMLNKLKNNSLTSHIPVILLTARHTVDYHIQSLKYGADYYLPKPLNIRLLFSAVNNILIQRQKFFQHVVAEGKQSSGIEDLKENPIITELDKKFLEDTVRIVNEHINDADFNIDAVADLVGMSRSGFFKKFKALTNTAPVDFLRDTRLEKAKSMFDEGHSNISTVAYAVGFNNPKYFSTCFKAKYALTPKEYVKKCSEKFAGNH